MQPAVVCGTGGQRGAAQTASGLGLGRISSLGSRPACSSRSVQDSPPVCDHLGLLRGSQVVYWSFPALRKSNKEKERLFVRKGTRGSSGPPGEAASINQLCAFIEKSSLRPAGGKPQLDGGWEKGAPAWKKGRHKQRWKGEKGQKKRSVLSDELDDDASPDFVPSKRRSDTRIPRKAAQPSSVYTQPDQRVRGTGPSQHSLQQEMSMTTHACVSFLQRRRSAGSGTGSWTWKVTGTRSPVLDINTDSNVWVTILPLQWEGSFSAGASAAALCLRRLLLVLWD